MKRSTDRILTTHTGSLPRPPEVLEIVEGKDQRDARQDPRFESRVNEATNAIVRRQVETGIDIPCDGEMARVGFSVYATERLMGFDGERRNVMQRVEVSMFPEFYQAMGTPLVGNRA